MYDMIELVHWWVELPAERYRAPPDTSSIESQTNQLRFAEYQHLETFDYEFPKRKEIMPTH